MTTVTQKEASEFILGLSSEQCDRIALEEGSMSIKVQSPTPPTHLTHGRTIDGWTLFWIPVKQAPVTWQLLVGAHTARTHRLAAEGRVARLVSDYGVDTPTAQRYTEAARGIQHGYTDTVIRIVLEAEAHSRAWDRFPGPSAAIRFWLNAYPQYQEVNHGKLVTANKIIKTLRGESEITPGGIRTLKAYNGCHAHQIHIPHVAANTLVAAWS